MASIFVTYRSHAGDLNFTYNCRFAEKNSRKSNAFCQLQYSKYSNVCIIQNPTLQNFARGINF